VDTTFEESTAAWSAISEEIALRLAGGGAALEVGCGSGFGCLAIAEAFVASCVVGHDTDRAAIARARALAAAADLDRRVRFEVSDSLGLARASFDLIVATGALARRDAQRLLNRIRNALVPEGACLVARTPELRLGPGGSAQLDAEIRALAIDAGFSRVRRVAGQGRAQVLELRR
jgi:cyclopropane fatty-acyl-phospholipid synthase-like methyltransferase